MSGSYALTVKHIDISKPVDIFFVTFLCERTEDDKAAYSVSRQRWGQQQNRLYYRSLTL